MNLTPIVNTIEILVPLNEKELGEIKFCIEKTQDTLRKNIYDLKHPIQEVSEPMQEINRRTIESWTELNEYYQKLIEKLCSHYRNIEKTEGELKSNKLPKV